MGGAGAEDSTMKLTLVHDAGVYGASRYNDENGGAVVLLTERAVLRARALLLRSVHRFAQRAFHRWAEFADMFVVRVTRQQFIAAMGAQTSIAWASSLFDQYDANGDGSVSQAELEAAMAAAATAATQMAIARASYETKQTAQPAGVGSELAAQRPPAKVAWAAAAVETQVAEAQSGQRRDAAEVEGIDLSGAGEGGGAERSPARREEGGEGGEPRSAKGKKDQKACTVRWGRGTGGYRVQARQRTGEGRARPRERRVRSRGYGRVVADTRTCAASSPGHGMQAPREAKKKGKAAKKKGKTKRKPSSDVDQ